MTLTCAQMDVLITFYIDKELSDALKREVESHLKECASCRAKYDIVKSMVSELKNCYHTKINNDKKIEEKNSYQFQLFKKNLSAYIDNELSNEENIKIKKITINNKRARKELENSYNIKKLMNDSFRKSQNEAKKDFSRQILKQLEVDEETIFQIHPVIKIIMSLTIFALTITAMILFFITR